MLLVRIKNILESQMKIETINEKLNANLDASELQNYNLQKQNFEKNLLDYEKSLNELNEENSDELESIDYIDQSLESLKPSLLSLSKTLQSEWRDIDLKIGKYEDEKKLFAPNAKCTLYGSSDAVTGLAYDNSDNTIHVGTSSGRSQFQGLNRINNTTTAVTTAISASDGLVAEQ